MMEKAVKTAGTNSGTGTSSGSAMGTATGSAAAGNSNNTNKPTPKDAAVIQSILKEAAITNYDSRVITQLLEFVHKQVSTVLEEARSVAGHAKKKNIDCEDVKLAGILLSERNQCSPPPRELLLELARGRNVCPLPLVKPHCGLRLPPDRYCLSSCNYRLTSDQNVRRTAGSTVHRGIQQVGSGAGVALKRPGIVTVPKTQTVNAPKPVFKFSTGKTPMKTDDGGKMDIDTDGQALKRKREDDDYDAL